MSSTTSASVFPGGAARPATIAGYVVTFDEMVGDIMNLHIGLLGHPLVALARALVKLDGVRVTGGSEGTGREPCYVVTCLGFKMVLSCPADGTADLAHALVSREPRPPLAVLSELGNILDGLMSAPPRPPSATPVHGRFVPGEEAEGDQVDRTGSRASLRRSSLRPGQPLARRTELRRKTPLARGSFTKSRPSRPETP